MKKKELQQKELVDVAWLKKFTVEELIDRESQFIKMTSLWAYNKVLNELEKE